MANLDLNDFSTNMMSTKPIYSEKKLRIGIIGTGGISCSHIPAYLNQPDVELVAACDLTPGKAEGRFKQFKIEGGKFFTDYKEMIDTVEMDAVSVCTYNTTHAECTIYALEHGLNVLLEKPFTVTLEEAIEVMKAEKRQQVYNLFRKYDIPIIEDGFNEELLYNSTHISPLSSIDKGGNGVIYISSFSKILFPG